MSDKFQRLVKITRIPCREQIELFDDAETALGEPNENTSLAKSFCKQCPIVNECLYEAMENDERYGIWGGFTTTERQRFKTQLGSIAA